MKLVAHQDTVTACGTDICRQHKAPHPFLLWGGVALAIREEGHLK